MSDRILEQSKNIVLSYLDSIGAKVEETEGLYKIEIPEEYTTIFGSRFKRITFSMDIAAENACELVAPGSNMLANIIEEWRKRAPAVTVRLSQHIDPNIIDNFKINARNAELLVQSHEPYPRLALCFYYLVTMKRIKKRLELRTVIVDLNDLSVRGPRGDIVFNESTFIPDQAYSEIDSAQLERAYSKSVKELEDVVSEETHEFLSEGNIALQKDLESIRTHYELRRKEVHEDLQYIKARVKEFQQKMTSARTTRTLTQFSRKKAAEEKKLQEESISADSKLKMLDKEEEIEIEKIKKRYRPVIEYSLIATAVARYNDSICNAKLENEYTTTNLQLVYDSLVSGLETKNCEICRNPMDSLYLCCEAHISCQNCIERCTDCNKYYCKNCEQEKLTPCYICKSGLCSECKKLCELCSSVICKLHAQTCNECSKVGCFFCSNECEICKSGMCKNHFKYCQRCGIAACGSHNNECEFCSLSLCSNDQDKCAICGIISCSSHNSPCNNCNQLYCQRCIVNQICKSCTNLNDRELDAQYASVLNTHDNNLIKIRRWKISENTKFVILRSDAFMKHHLIVVDRTANKVIHHVKRGVRAR